MRRRPRKRLKERDVIEDSNVCKLCKEGPDEELFGKLFVDENSGFKVHQYCMFFSSGLAQRGEDNEGFDGFLIKDIKKEISRSKRLRCNECRNPGATIGCCDARCHQTFHYKCGRQRGALFQFFDCFNSFCMTHRPSQHVNLALSSNQTCPICWCKIEWNSKTPISDTPLVTPCCKSTWFHNSCLQSHAKSSGLYYFRCPICNNMDKFQEEMKRMGIYIPEQDASWEKEDAFADLLFQYSRCDAKKCICPHGREHKETAGKWRIRLCDICGQTGTHLKCQHWKKSPGEWHCDVCGTIQPYSSTRRKPVGDRSMDLSDNDDDDDDESSSAEDGDVNVCSVSDDETPLSVIKTDINSTRNASEDGNREHVREGASPMRKRCRLSLLGTSGNAGTSDHKEDHLTKSQDTATSSGLRFHDILDSTSMTSCSSLLLAFSDAVSTVWGGRSVTCPHQGSANMARQKSVKMDGEAIVIRDTDSDSSEVELINPGTNFDRTNLTRKPINKHKKNTEAGDTCSKFTESVNVARVKSPGKGKQHLRMSTGKTSTFNVAEADSSAPECGETASQGNLPGLESKQEPFDSDDDECLITNVVKKSKKSCPVGNDKLGMKCYLDCCNPARYHHLHHSSFKFKDLQSKTVSSTSYCDHVKEKSSKAVEQNLLSDKATAVVNDEEKVDACSIGTNTPPFKPSSSKELSSTQTGTTQLYFPVGKTPASPSGGKKRLNLRSKKSGSYLKKFCALYENQMPVNHKCSR